MSESPAQPVSPEPAENARPEALGFSLDSAGTPLMRQYAAVKKQHPNALLFFRLGDFYELFFDDAITASKELQITLTSRNKEKGVAVPMCGVPYHAAEGYVAKLIRKGYKVAICEQVEDPKPRSRRRSSLSKCLGKLRQGSCSLPHQVRYQPLCRA